MKVLCFMFASLLAAIVALESQRIYLSALYNQPDPVLTLRSAPAQIGWALYGDDHIPEGTRKLNAAADFLWKELDRAPRLVNLHIEIGPTDGAIRRIMTDETYAAWKQETPVYAWANHYDDGMHVITMMPVSLDYDWRARAVLVHELEHVRLNNLGFKPDTECGRLVHEIRAIRTEMNHYELTGVPTTGEGLTFREHSATLLKRYNRQFLTNNCNGR